MTDSGVTGGGKGNNMLYLSGLKQEKVATSEIINRVVLEVEKKAWIRDCFKEKNYPLEIAEIELSNEEEDLMLPSFISKEITGLTHYSNFSLANNPFSDWE